MDPYAVIVRPHVTEKTMNLIDRNNELTFVVLRESNKATIKNAFEKLFDEKVKSINTHINSKGYKLAYITLTEESKAEDIAVRMGVF
ncbi:50S ribosomal protein L23 [Methanobrevibacter cuticularis]|uniref:Large ribosomal subunit protein uL23 n=1 Tax=Methanobrevibacter cuticularis TaxID=47311 RepID=A0A166FKT4_9EURY|nr:50S ribosomal protein L23 [Methanobrevibacter cuticularis]KZX17778.1 50S ribosomal protein L23 [Methanobrevibacter cuticularis]